MKKYKVEPIGNEDYCVVDDKDIVVTDRLMDFEEATQIANDMNEMELSIAMAKTFISENN